MVNIYARVLFFAMLSSQAAMAGLEVQTPEGRAVLLKDDHTWEYLPTEEAEENPQALLSVVGMKSIVREQRSEDACQVGVKIDNALPFKITNLALRFAVFIRESLLYDQFIRSFSEIRPTEMQYRRVIFRGIQCKEIDHVKVEDPGRCAMGPLNKFSSQPGECIAFIKVQDSPLVKIFK